MFNLLAIDGSPPIDTTAEAVVVESFDELDAMTKHKKNAVKGKIVVFVQRWQGYGNTVKYRRSAEKVQEYGAIAVLAKSVGPFSLSTPHTGAGARGMPTISALQRYTYNIVGTKALGAKIPAACITLEEAEMLQRMQARGQKLVIRLKFTCVEGQLVTSRNIIFDLKGKHPNADSNYIGSVWYNDVLQAQRNRKKWCC